MNKEPAVIIGAIITAALALARVLGFHAPPELDGAVINLTNALLAVPFITGLIIRFFVASPDYVRGVKASIKSTGAVPPPLQWPDA